MAGAAGGARRGWHALLATALVLAAFAAFRSDWLADPFIRNDDYLAYFPTPDLFYIKTIEEGRWGNWLWTLRGVPGERHVLFALYLALWAGTAALVSAAVFAADRRPWRTLAFGFALAAMPQMAMLALWFNTTLAGRIVLVGFAALVPFLSRRGMLWAVPAFTLLSFVTYQPDAFLVLAIALALGPWRPGRAEIARVCLTFCAGYLASVLAVFALNWLFHGTFGIELAAWRNAHPAHDLASLVENLSVLAPLPAEGQANDPVVALVVPLATLALPAFLLLAAARPGPDWLRQLLAGLGLSLGIVIAQAVLSGTQLPQRGTGFVWGFVVLGLAMAARRMQARAWLPTGAALALGVAGSLAWLDDGGGAFADYQRFSRTMAERVLAADPAPAQILIAGDPAAYPEARALVESIGLAFRLRDLTGADARPCQTLPGSEIGAEIAIGTGAKAAWNRRFIETRALCDQHRAALQAIPARYPEPGSVVPLGEGVVAIRLRD